MNTYRRLPHDADTLTHCHEGHKPVFMDERALGLGIRCLWCGRSAEHRVPRAELSGMMNRSPRESMEIERVQESTPDQA